MPLKLRSTDTDLMAKLRFAVDEAVEAARAFRNVIGLVEDLIRHRVGLTAALDVLRGVEPRERDRVLREAQLAFVRRERDFAEAQGRTELVRAWTSLLIEATEKVAREQDDAADLAAAMPERDDEDRAWADAAISAAGRWDRD